MKRASFLRRIGGAFVFAATASLFDVKVSAPTPIYGIEVVCPRCNGNGEIRESLGSGAVSTSPYIPRYIEPRFVPCPWCKPYTVDKRRARNGLIRTWVDHGVFRGIRA